LDEIKKEGEKLDVSGQQTTRLITMGSIFTMGIYSKQTVSFKIAFRCGNPNACLGIAGKLKPKQRKFLEVLKVIYRTHEKILWGHILGQTIKSH